MKTEDGGEGTNIENISTQRSPSAFYCLFYEILLSTAEKRCVIADIITFDGASKGKENRLNIFHVGGRRRSDKF